MDDNTLWNNNLHLTHYSPVLLFYIPWKHLKTFRFSDVFRGYRKATTGCNGLNKKKVGIFCYKKIDSKLYESHETRNVGYNKI